MTNRDDLVRQIHASRNDGRALAQAVAALDAHDAAQRARAAAERELDLGAGLADRRLAPAVAHELHTAATDWIADFELPDDGRYRTAMIAEASTWYQGLDPAVKADGQELAEQARGRAGTLASGYPSQYIAARREFLQTVGYLAQREGASGLPQIDQTVDPDNAPSPTPYPAEVFPTFGEEQDPFNGVEDNNHGSQISSDGAPMLQQVRQQDSSGSGFGSGPERPDEHSTGFDTGDSYAEVPLGPPGQIPATPAATDRQVGSAPNPVAGQPQDAGADRRPTVKAMAGYSAPDPFGYRWVMQPEIMHPFHEKCASAHWPDEACGDRSRTAGIVAVGYATNLDDAHRLARAERAGVIEGLQAIASAAHVAALAAHHNRFAAAWDSSGQGEDDTAVLHGFMAVVRPVLAERGIGGAVTGYVQEMAKEYAPGRGLDFKQGASSLTQIQQTTDANNAETPQDDQLPDGVAFPISDSFTQQWVTGPEGAQPKGGQKEAATMNGLPTEAAQYFGRMDALEGKQPHHKTSYPFSAKAHGTYLRSWNDTHAAQAAISGDDPVTREDYAAMTGRPDLYPHWRDAYDQATRARASRATAAIQRQAGDSGEGVHPDSDRCLDCGHLRGCNCPHQCEYPDGSKTGSRRVQAGDSGEGVDPDNDHCTDCGHLRGRCNCGPQHTCEYGDSFAASVRDELARQQRHGSRRVQADTWSQPRQTTDDASPPFSSPATAPVPGSSNTDPQDGDYSAGAAAGKADKAAGQRPAFADNSSGVSPYVKGYAEAYGAAGAPQGAQDVPVGIGGDNGQGALDQEAQQAFQRSKASRTAGLRRVSAAFAPDELLARPEFRKGYLFATRWQPGQRLVATGSAEFEAGLYAGVTDRPRIQQMWLAAHATMAQRHASLGRRIELHGSFTEKTARSRGIIAAGTYLTAGVSTDLITDGPGTSPDPMGATPLNGPGTPPPMGGRDEAATPGGAPPYQGAPPMPGGPVVPDDVMGHPQQQPQPSGPFTNTFSGDHPENMTLAPVAPDSAAEPGYSNRDAYQGAPQGGDRVAKLAAFRRRVQAGLAAMNEQEAAR